ncbi:hypothetical protein HZH68_003736 [Vespula germanica]|uniref:Uncharacterized protein n=1 Tax=Vespula germanica TaxID=30212 RepID=A0A834NPR1_VESGE|nr:hypothetical protein HZH68_003736 [Vespula germanica]
MARGSTAPYNDYAKNSIEISPVLRTHVYEAVVPSNVRRISSLSRNTLSNFIATLQKSSLRNALEVVQVWKSPLSRWSRDNDGVDDYDDDDGDDDDDDDEEDEDDGK